MVQESKSVVLGRKLVELHSAFDMRSKNLMEVWADNFTNANAFVVETITLADKEHHADLLISVYVLAKKDLVGELPFERLVRLFYGERDKKTTPYGRMLIKIRFCLGFLANMKRGDLVTDAQCEALIFAYESYWHFGEDYLLGTVIERFLSYLPATSEWAWPEEAKFGGQEKARQFQWLGYAIGDSLMELARFHKLSQPVMASFISTVPKKPEFKDFRKILKQIHAAVLV